MGNKIGSYVQVSGQLGRYLLFSRHRMKGLARVLTERTTRHKQSKEAKEDGLRVGAGSRRKMPLVGQRRPALPRTDSAVPSALGGLTSGFGMGPGVPPLPWSLTNKGHSAVGARRRALRAAQRDDRPDKRVAVR